jgi:hypothetical protein
MTSLPTDQHFRISVPYLFGVYPPRATERGAACQRLKAIDEGISGEMLIYRIFQFAQCLTLTTMTDSPKIRSVDLIASCSSRRTPELRTAKPSPRCLLPLGLLGRVRIVLCLSLREGVLNVPRNGSQHGIHSACRESLTDNSIK